MSTIDVTCVDQVLAFTNMPVIASGGIHENMIHFTFSSDWDGYTKVCIFYRQRGEYYYSIMDNSGNALIPDAMTQSEGKVCFGIVGQKDDGTQKTTDILSYEVVEGVYSTTDQGEPDYDPEFTKFITGVQEMISNKADIGHKHDASDITSGTLPVARGGTGRSTLTSGAILLGNGTSSVTQKTGTGALYAETSGVPTFGTLPIAQGGTGKTSLTDVKSSLGISDLETFHTNQVTNNGIFQATLQQHNSSIESLETFHTNQVTVNNVVEAALQQHNGSITDLETFHTNQVTVNEIFQAALQLLGKRFQRFTVPKGGSLLIDPGTGLSPCLVFFYKSTVANRNVIYYVVPNTATVSDNKPMSNVYELTGSDGTEFTPHTYNQSATVRITNANTTSHPCMVIPLGSDTELESFQVSTVNSTT